MKTDFGKWKNKKLLVSFVNVLFLGVMIGVLVLLYGAVSLGWFARSENVSGNGMGAQIAKTGSVEVFIRDDNAEYENTQGDEYPGIGGKQYKKVGVSEITAGSPKIGYNPQAPENLYPGVSGSFTFYVNDSTDFSSENNFIFDYKVSAENNRPDYKGSSEYPDGFYKNASSAEREEALKYLNSHLMFFKSKDGEKFSDWIRPSEVVTVNTSGLGNPPYEVTIYWIWVADYNQIFAENSPVVDEATRATIAAYYQLSKNSLCKFEEDEDQNTTDEITLEKAYNTADTFMGSVIKHIFFKVEVY